MSSKQDEKNAKALREFIARVPENKRCADCTARGPVYACITFNTFICTTCSGIHREFTHRVKSISMATFKPEEMKGLLEGGNQKAREKWLEKWNPDENPEPSPGDTERIRRFIRLKYIDRKWVSYEARSNGASTRSRKSSQGSKTSMPPAEPLSNILGEDLPPMNVGSNQAAAPSSNNDWASFDNVNWEGASTAQSGQSGNPFGSPPAQSGNPFGSSPVQSTTSAASDLAGLDFFSSPQPNPAQPVQPVQPVQQPVPVQQHFQQGNPQQQGMAQQQGKPQQQQQRGVDLHSQLNQLYQQQAQQNQQQQMQQQQMMMQQMMAQMQQQGQMTPQQQQMFMQMMQSGMMGQGSPGGGMGMNMGSPPFGGNMGGQGFGSMPSGGGQQGFMGVAATGTGTPPTGGNPFGGPIEPEPKKEVKPDPFASLAIGKIDFNPKPKPSPSTSQPADDPFGLGGSSPALSAAPTATSGGLDDDFFGVSSSAAPQQQENPFGGQSSAPPPDDFNPFF